MKLNFLVFNFLLKTTLHILFWIGVFFFYNYFLGFGSENVEYINRFSLFLMPVTISISYFFIYYLIPKYLFNKKEKLFILYTCYTLIISFFFISFSILFGLVFSENLKKEGFTPITKGLMFVILGVYFIIFIVVIIGLLKHNYEENNRNDELKNKFLRTQLQLKEQELKFLKMQIHPHFLFNTLNTLYGFALKKSDDTPDMILKLSNLLDYILYQVEKPSVLLTDEIKHIDDYIALEKMRFQDSLKVSFSKEINQKNIQISPMLLLPFVENAFKHGAQINGVLNIDMQLKTTNENFIFLIKNSSKKANSTQKGIGLKNIQKRLKMQYQNSFDLVITSEENQFKVQLEIPFKNV